MAKKRKKRKKVVKRTVRSAKCAYCSKKKPVLATEADDGWELEGHPDHIDRNVCRDCWPDVGKRDVCSGLIFEAMRKFLRKKKKDWSETDIENAVHIAWRSFNVDLDYDVMITWAKRLKVSHPWLTAKKKARASRK